MTRVLRVFFVVVGLAASQVVLTSKSSADDEPVQLCPPPLWSCCNGVNIPPPVSTQVTACTPPSTFPQP